MFGFKRRAVASTEPSGAVADEHDTATAPAVATESALLWAIVAGYANGEARITRQFIDGMPDNPVPAVSLLPGGDVVIRATR